MFKKKNHKIKILSKKDHLGKLKQKEKAKLN